MGIQQLVRQMPVLFAILNVGTAMSATTAGRMPINMAETQGMSMKWRKHMAMARMMRNEGSAVPNAVHLVSYEDADVDGKYARAALGDGEHVDKLVLAHPPSLLYHFGFDEGYHGVASTQGEGANLDKRLECF